MDRIAQTFADAKRDGRTLFVTYLCAGDPDLETSLEACRAVIDAGTDILELGVPFSDPLADGLTNQLAAERALASGMTQAKVLELVTRIREFSSVPIVFYTYYNLVFSQGVEAYARRIKEAGVDGVLILDLPPEEASEVAEAFASNEVRSVYIVAPTTPERRIPLIANAATGFIYYVSREGVTGERSDLAGNIEQQVAVIRKQAGDTPLVVGFGISTPEHVRRIAAVADGVVVGSAVVNCIANNLDDRDAIISALHKKVSSLRKGLEPAKMH